MKQKPNPRKLEPLRWRHAHDLQRVANDPGMPEWSNMPQSYFSGGAQSLIQRSLHQASKDGGHILALYVEEELSGVFNLGRERLADTAGSLLFWIESLHWRSGKAADYLRDAVSFAKREVDMTHVATTCLERNTLCVQALEQAGFRRCGRRRSLADGETELRFIAD